MATHMVCPNVVVASLLMMMVSMVFVTLCDSYTEVFSITTDANETSYYAGNIDSNFFIAKRGSDCSFQWTSSAGSATGDDDNDENREIFYDVVVGSNGFIYAVGTTKGNFSFPEDEVPTLDAAVVVYKSSDGSLVRQAQYDVDDGLDDIAGAVAQKPDGTLLVAVYGSPPNVQNTAVYSTKVLEISPDSLELVRSHSVEVQTSGTFASITGGPTILDMVYVESQEAVVAVGQILGRGLLFMFSLSTGTVVSQTEWGNIIGNMQIGGLATDHNGAFFVTGSSSEIILENGDLQSVAASEFHAYVIRYDNLLLAEPELTWVRQLAGSGSSQSGDDVVVDPTTGAVVVIGSFDASFAVTDEQSGSTFELSTITSDGLTDIFVWYLDAESGAFSNLRISFASTASEDRGNAVEVLSSGRLEIGGVINDGTDDSALACDEQLASSSPTPSASVSSSVLAAPSTTPVLLASPSPSSSVAPLNSNVVSATQQPLEVEVTPSLVLTQPSVTPSGAIQLISGTPSVSPSRTASPSPSDAALLTSVTPSIRASVRPSETVSSTPSTQLSTTSASPSGGSGIIIGTPSASASIASSASPSEGMGVSSALPSVGASVAPSSSLAVGLGSVSATPSVRASVGASTSPLGSAAVSTAPSSSLGIPAASATMVLFISSTPTLSPSASNRDLVAPSDIMEMVSDAPGTSLSFSEVPSTSSAPPSVTPSMSLVSTSQTPSASKLPILTSISPSASHLASPTVSFTMVLLISSSPTPSPSTSKIDLLAPSDVAETVSASPSSSTTLSSSESPLVGVDVPSPLQSIDVSASPSVGFTDALESVSASPSPEVQMGASVSPSGSSERAPATPGASQLIVPNASATMVLFMSSTPSPSSLAINTNGVVPSDVLEVMSEAPTVAMLVSETPSVTSGVISDTLDTNSPTPSASRLPLLDESAVPSPSKRDVVEPTEAPEAPSATIPFSEMPFPSSASPAGSLQTISATPRISGSATLVVLISSTSTSSPSVSERNAMVPSNGIQTTLEASSTAIPHTVLPSIAEGMETSPIVPDVEVSANPSMSVPDASEGLSGTPSRTASVEAMSPSGSPGGALNGPSFNPSPIPSASATMVFLTPSVLTTSPFPSKSDLVAPSDLMEAISEAPSTALLFSETPFVTSGIQSDSLDSSTLLPSASTLVLPIESTTASVLVSPSPRPSASSSRTDGTAPSDPMETISEASSYATTTPFILSVSPDDGMDVNSPVPRLDISISPSVIFPDTMGTTLATPFPSRDDLVTPSNAVDTSSDAPSTTLLFSQMPETSSTTPSDLFDTGTVAPSASRAPIASASSVLVPLVSSTPTPSLLPKVSERDLVVPSDVPEMMSEAPTTIVLSSETPLPSTNLVDSLDTSSPAPSPSRFPTPVASGTVVQLISSTPTSSLSPSVSTKDLVIPVASDLMEMSEAPSTTALTSDAPLISQTLLMDPSDTGSPAPSEAVTRIPIPGASATMVPFISPTPTRSPSGEKTSVVAPSEDAASISDVPMGIDGSPTASETPIVPTSSPTQSTEPSESAASTAVNTPSVVVGIISATPSASSVPTPRVSETVVVFISATPSRTQPSPAENLSTPRMSPGAGSPNPSDTVFDIVATESVLPTTATLPAQSTSFPSELANPSTSFSPSPTSAPEPEDISEVTPVSSNSDTPSGTEPVLSVSNVLVTPSFSLRGTASPSFTPSAPVASALVTPFPKASVSVTPFAPTASSDDTIPSDMQPTFSSLTVSPPMLTEPIEPNVRDSPQPGETNLDDSQGTPPSDTPAMTATQSPTDTSSLETANPGVTARPTELPTSGSMTPGITSSAVPSGSTPVASPGSTTPSLSLSAIPATLSRPPSLGTPSSSFISATPVASALATPIATNPNSVDAPDDMPSTAPSFDMDPLFTETLELDETPLPPADELSPEDSRGTSPFESDATSTTTAPSPTPDVPSPEPSQVVTPRPTQLATPSSSDTATNLGSASPSRTRVQESLLVSTLSSTPLVSPSLSAIASSFISAAPPASVVVTPLPTIESSVSADVPQTIPGLQSPSPGNSEREEVFASFSASPSASVEDTSLPVGTPTRSTSSTPIPTSSRSVESSLTESASPEPTPVSVLLLFSPTATPEIISPEVSVMVTVSPSTILPTQTFAITGEPTPSVAVSVMLWTPSPDPTVTDPCSNLPSVVADSSLLSQTEYFQRVRLRLQVAGPNMTNTCHLTDDIVQRFVNLSAISTLSSAHLWFITSIEDGPPVVEDGSTPVVVEEEVRAAESMHPQHSANPEDVEELFPGSVIFGVTSFLSPFSVELIEAAYVDYVRSQNIVRALRQRGHNEIHWTGIISEPVIVDKRRAPTTEVTSGVSGGYVAGIAFGTLLIIGAAVFIVAEAGRPV